MQYKIVTPKSYSGYVGLRLSPSVLVKFHSPSVVGLADHGITFLVSRFSILDGQVLGLDPSNEQAPSGSFHNPRPAGSLL